MKALRTEYHREHQYKEVFVEVDPEVYKAFAEAEFGGDWTLATEMPNVVVVEVGTMRDASKWQHVLQDDILSVMS